ncbi:hypothetical protein MMC21_002459 [Puttea exsequens]|nr:hypothetical protein [Puttea exsequens]
MGSTSYETSFLRQLQSFNPNTGRWQGHVTNGLDSSLFSHPFLGYYYTLSAQETWERWPQRLLPPQSSTNSISERPENVLLPNFLNAWPMGHPIIGFWYTVDEIGRIFAYTEEQLLARNSQENDPFPLAGQDQSMSSSSAAMAVPMGNYASPFFQLASDPAANQSEGQLRGLWNGNHQIANDPPWADPFSYPLPWSNPTVYQTLGTEETTPRARSPPTRGLASFHHNYEQMAVSSYSALGHPPFLPRSQDDLANGSSMHRKPSGADMLQTPEQRLQNFNGVAPFMEATPQFPFVDNYTDNVRDNTYSQPMQGFSATTNHEAGYGAYFQATHPATITPPNGNDFAPWYARDSYAPLPYLPANDTLFSTYGQDIHYQQNTGRPYTPPNEPMLHGAAPFYGNTFLAEDPTRDVGSMWAAMGIPDGSAIGRLEEMEEEEGANPIGRGSSAEPMSSS